MKAVIYYFSATGNSLSIARDIALELGGAQVLSITRLARGEKISTDADTVGIVYPVYAFGVPLIVERFIERLELRKDQYVFLVANYAGMQGAGLTRAYRLLKHKGISTKAGFGLVMPNNYTPFGEAVSKERQAAILGKEKEKTKRIAEAVKNKETLPPETGFFLARWLFAEPIRFISARMMRSEDKNFSVNEKCDGCGVCAKVCPVGNIEIKEKKPLWKHSCELCMACFHWCPKEAIEFGKSTIGKKRYRHPGINIADIMGQG